MHPTGQAPLHPQRTAPPTPSSPAPAPIPALQRATERGLARLAHWGHSESTAGIVLLLAALAALLWANSGAAGSYHALWHQPVGFTLGPWQVQTDLHFIVNDVLMTVFFLVVGMEIRREIHNGALASLRQASLPLVAALGGVLVPALLYLALVGSQPGLRSGWAVPTATDIAFAVGVLALLGRHIPPALRIFLLALAIIDDIAAVLIIAFVYSGGLDYSGFAIAALGMGGVLLLQHMGAAMAWLYVVPGAVLWWGLLQTGAHPTLAGVVLGLMTPVALRAATRPHLEVAQHALQQVQHAAQHGADSATLRSQLRVAQAAQRDLLAPVERIPMALHPWVAFGVMPVFALANAGVSMAGIDLSASAPQTVAWAIAVALLLGKPLGVLLATWLAVRTRLCSLPAGVNWRGVLLVGLLAGIGFTMSIFVGGLAFSDAALLGAAKTGILAGSGMAAVLGLGYGLWVRRRLND